MYDKINPLGKQLYLITRQYVGVLSHMLNDCGLDRHYYPLWVIGQAQEPLSQQQLAVQLEVDKVLVTRIVDNLESQGFLRRELNPHDRRSYQLQLTLKGKKLIPIIGAAFEHLNTAAFEGFTCEEVTRFLDQVQAIRKNLCGKPAEEIAIDFERIKTRVPS